MGCFHELIIFIVNKLIMQSTHCIHRVEHSKPFQFLRKKCLVGAEGVGVGTGQGWSAETFATNCLCVKTLKVEEQIWVTCCEVGAADEPSSLYRPLGDG